MFELLFIGIIIYFIVRKSSFGKKKIRNDFEKTKGEFEKLISEYKKIVEF